MVDIRSLVSQIPMEPGYVPAPPQPDLTAIQRLMGLPQTLRAVGQNLAVGAASLPYGIYQGFGNPAAGEAAMSQFQQEYGYTPTNPAAQQQLQGLGEFLQQLETEYKIPPIMAPVAATPALGIRGMVPQTERLARELVDEIQTTPPTGAISPEIAAKVLPSTRVASETNQPIVAYHATGKEIAQLDPAMASGKSAGTGTFFSSNPYTASTYALGESPNVIPAYLDFKTPMVVDAGGANWNRLNRKAKVDLPDAKQTTLGKIFGDEMRYADDYTSTDDLARYAKQQGYDGLIVRNIVDHGPAGRFSTDEALEPSDIYVAFDKQNIRSALSDEQMAGLLDEPAQSVSRMFHGTDKAFDEYRVKNRGLAYYFTPDPEQAGFYSGMGEGANIRPVELNVKNTYRGGDVDKIMEAVKKEDDYYPYSLSKIQESLENQTPLAFHTPSVVKALKKLGYDSFAEYEGGIEQIGVFSAKNVKPSFGQR